VTVRRVTALNKGRKTAGIDKQVVVTDKQKVKLVQKLRLDGKALAIRQIYIDDKPGKREKQPLCIPTINDRAKQALYKLALEGEREARSEENSYESRLGQCCHDAIEAIFLSLRNNSKEKRYHKYVLDLDIFKCFDQIDHDYLINKLDTLPELKE
jgi:RNA-directed DNA polymerase